MKSPKAQLWVILSIVFFGFLGLSMPYLVLPSLFLDPSNTILSPDWSDASRNLFLGISLAAYPFGQFIGAPILGALSDEYGRRNVMSASLLAAFTCSLFKALSLKWEILWLLITSRFLLGLMEGNLAIARAMAADIKQLNKHDTFGKINAAASTSYVLGPILGALLSDNSIHKDLTPATPFFIISVLFFVLSIISYIVISKRSSSVQSTKRSFKQRVNFIHRLKSLFKNRHLKLLLIVVSLQTLAIDIFFEFAPVYLTVKWSFDPIKLIIYNSVLSIALAIGSAYLPSRLSTRYSIRHIAIYSMMALPITLLMVVLTSSPIVMLTTFALVGFSIAIVTTNLTVQVSDAAPDEIQGEIMGVQTSLRALGDTMICLLGGVLLTFSPSLVLVLAAVLSLASLIYYIQKNKT